MTSITNAGISRSVLKITLFHITIQNKYNERLGSEKSTNVFFF